MSRNGLPVDLERDREWRERSARKYAEKQQRARVEVTRQGARTTVRRTPIKPVSDKRRIEAAVYRVRRIAFLEAHEFRCAFPLGCTDRATTIQHTQGRIRDRYLDESKWKPSCAAHNQWAEDNPVESKRVGWSVPRVGLAVEMSTCEEVGDAVSSVPPQVPASLGASSVAPAADTTGHLTSTPALVVSGPPENGAT